MKHAITLIIAKTTLGGALALGFAAMPHAVPHTDAPAWGADRGDRGVARARVGGVHGGDLRAQPGRRAGGGGGQFQSSMTTS